MAKSNNSGGAWYEQKETASSDTPLKLTLFLVRILPHWLLALLAFPVVFFYWISCPKARAAASLFQKQLCTFAKKKIRVNSVSPGVIETPINANQNYMKDPVLRAQFEAKHLLGLGQCTDISNACIYLLSDASRWVTGQNLVIDGGYTVR